MSLHVLICGALLLVASFAVSIEQKDSCANQGLFSAAATVLSTCDNNGAPGRAAIAKIVTLTACVSAFGAPKQNMSADHERERVSAAAIENAAEEGSNTSSRVDVCNVDSLSTEQMLDCFLNPTDTSQTQIKVSSCGTVFATMDLRTCVQLPPVLSVSLVIEPVDGSGNKVNFGYRNTYLYPLIPSLRPYWYRLDVAAMLQNNPPPGSYKLTMYVSAPDLVVVGGDCIVAFALSILVV